MSLRTTWDSWRNGTFGGAICGSAHGARRAAGRMAGTMIEALEARRLMAGTGLDGPDAAAFGPAASGPAALIESLRQSPRGASYPRPWQLAPDGLRFIGPVEAGDAGPVAVFDATSYAGRPAASRVLPGLTFTDRDFLAHADDAPAAGGTDPARHVSESAARRLARAADARGQLLVLDLTGWRLDGRSAPAGEVAANAAAARRVIDWIKSERPGVQVGVHGLLASGRSADWATLNTYLGSTSGDRTAARAGYAAWRSANDAVGPLARSADFVAPSLRSASADPDGWQAFARGVLAEARRFGRPVLGVLHRELGRAGDTATPDAAAEVVPSQVWAEQLAAVADFADGAILAGGAGRTWSADGGRWWKATRDFLEARPAGPAAPAPTAPAGVDAAARDGLFPVYDTLLNVGRPSSEALGLERMAFANHHSTSDIALKQHADVAVKAGVPLMLNIHEHLPADARVADEASVRASLATIDRAVEIIRAHQPGLEFGFYSIFPRRDFWTPVKAESVRRQLAASDAGITQAEVAQQENLADHYDLGADGRWHLKGYARNGLLGKLAQVEPPEAAWKAANARFDAVAAKVPVIFPSIYLFYDDPVINDLYIEAQVREAKRYGARVLPVLMLHYHESNAALGGRAMDDEVMRAAIRSAARAGADGLTLWEGEAAFPAEFAHLIKVVRAEAAAVSAERAAAQGTATDD